MQAEDLPVTGWVCEHLLLACRTTGNVPKARSVVQDVARRSIPVTLKMYTHLVHTFATAMRLPGTTDNERVVHVRHAWQVVGDARRRGLPLTTSLLNGVSCA